MTYGILIQDRDELVYVFKRYTHIYTFEIKKRLNVPQCFSMMVVQVGKDLLLVQETQEMWVRSWDGKFPLQGWLFLQQQSLTHLLPDSSPAPISHHSVSCLSLCFSLTHTCTHTRAGFPINNLTDTHTCSYTHASTSTCI